MQQKNQNVLSFVQQKLSFLRGKAARGRLRMEEIRLAMLNCLDKDVGHRFPQIERRIQQAPSLPALWFIRPELLMALATSAGEQAAQQTLREISKMFEGMLPSSLNARPSFQFQAH